MRMFALPGSAILGGILAIALNVSPAFAQATRTWVSGVGDDANPCSRTAPCKTFAGAISKTAASGEISVLDPGGYGAVTITKSITLSGVGTLAGILNAGSNGSTVNMINSSILGSDFNGVVAAGTSRALNMALENCLISNGGNAGIWAGALSILRITNTLVARNVGVGLYTVDGGQIISFGNNR